MANATARSEHGPNPWMQAGSREQSAAMLRAAKRHGELAAAHRNEHGEVVCRFTDGHLSVITLEGVLNGAAAAALGYSAREDEARRRLGAGNFGLLGRDYFAREADRCARLAARWRSRAHTFRCQQGKV